MILNDNDDDCMLKDHMKKQKPKKKKGKSFISYHHLPLF